MRATMPFVWRGHTMSPPTRAGPSLELELVAGITQANPVGILTIEMDPTPEMKAKLAAAHMVYLGRIIDHIWVQPRYIYEQNAKLFSPSGSCI